MQPFPEFVLLGWTIASSIAATIFALGWSLKYRGWPRNLARFIIDYGSRGAMVVPPAFLVAGGLADLLELMGYHSLRTMALRMQMSAMAGNKIVLLLGLAAALLQILQDYCRQLYALKNGDDVGPRVRN